MKLRGLFALLVLAPGHLALEQADDSFEAIDQMLNQQFEATDELINARYEAINLAVDHAFKGLTKSIEVDWGKDACTS